MREIGAFEAKNRFGQLLDHAERGEEILITRHGKAVARLVPVQPTRQTDVGRAALARIRARAEARRTGPFVWEKWRAYRDEGRS